jgi:hypothetical protein
LAWFLVVNAPAFLGVIKKGKKKGQKVLVNRKSDITFAAPNKGNSSGRY